VSDKTDWEAHVVGAKAAKESISVVDLEWDKAVLYAADRIAGLEAERSALVSALTQFLAYMAVECMAIEDLDETIANKIRNKIYETKKVLNAQKV